MHLSASVALLIRGVECAVGAPLTRKSGLHIRGADMQHDPFRSMQKRPVFSLAPVGSSSLCTSRFPSLRARSGLCPSLSTFLAKKENIETGAGAQWKAGKELNRLGYRQAISNTSSLALEMVQTVGSWLGPRNLRVQEYSEYAGGSIIRQLPVHAELISRMTMLV
jgi:hypothetical protein